MAADCKSARVSVRQFESDPIHHPPLQGDDALAILASVACHLFTYFFNVSSYGVAGQKPL